MRIEPTAGRVVWFRPGQGDPLGKGLPEGVPLAATVAFVHQDGRINLTVHDMDGGIHSRRNVALLQDGERMVAGVNYAEWMPYQKGQAARTEQLERAGGSGGSGGRHIDLALGDAQGTRDLMGSSTGNSGVHPDQGAPQGNAQAGG